MKAQGEEDDTKLNAKEATAYRGILANATYLCQDRTDLKFAVKELCRIMSEATQSVWESVKKLVSYLIDGLVESIKSTN